MDRAGQVLFVGWAGWVDGWADILMPLEKRACWAGRVRAVRAAWRAGWAGGPGRPGRLGRLGGLRGLGGHEWMFGSVWVKGRYRV